MTVRVIMVQVISWTFRVYEIKQQNGSDCGVFVW